MRTTSVSKTAVSRKERCSQLFGRMCIKTVDGLRSEGGRKKEETSMRKEKAFKAITARRQRERGGIMQYCSRRTRVSLFRRSVVTTQNTNATLSVV